MNDLYRDFAAFLCAVAVAGALPARADGFFRVRQIGGSEWMIGPDGNAAPFLGIDDVRPFGWKDHALGFDVYSRFVETNYPSREAWVDETIDRLRDWGFNTLANHCDEPQLRHRGLGHTLTLYLGGKFARGDDPDRWITKWTGPCTGFPNVFNPDFERVVRERARELCAPHRDDQWLVGWFLDNELKWWGSTVARKDLTLFDTVRALPPEHTARMALERFVEEWQEKHRSGESAGDSGESGASSANAMREEFVALVAERYFSVLCGAIREADPNHIILGCRFASPFTATHRVVWEAAGRYCDIVSFNFYPWADLKRGVVLDFKGGTPVVERIRELHEWCRKPLIVTEWSFPALDTGRPCFHGAGQRHLTQAGRAEASALYARTLLSLPFVAGYSYFMFLDQPKSGISETFREDSNYGLVNEFGRPYEEVVSALRDVQRDAAVIHAAAGEHPEAIAAGERPRIVFGEKEVGSLGVMLQWKGPEGDVWTHASAYSVLEQREKCATIRATADENQFAILFRISRSADERFIDAEILAVENRGDASLEFSGVFFVPMPQDGAVAEPVVPELWGAPERAWWRNPDGTIWGAVSDSPTAIFRFWESRHGKKDSVIHADARFTTGPHPVILPPGTAWIPQFSMAARIGLLTDFPETTTNPDTRTIR